MSDHPYVVGLPVQPWTIPAEGSVKAETTCCGILVWLLPDEGLNPSNPILCPQHIPQEDRI